MIVLILAFGALVLLAIVVGIVDRFGAVNRRMVAAQRRDEWERRHHGVRIPSVEG